MKRRRITGAVVVAVVLVGAGCSSQSARATGAVAQAKHAVGILTETFIDTGRATAAWGPDPSEPTRTLVTTILYPAIGPPSSRAPRPGAKPDRRQGHYPLIVFAH